MNKGTIWVYAHKQCTTCNRKWNWGEKNKIVKTEGAKKYLTLFFIHVAFFFFTSTNNVIGSSRRYLVKIES
jgi:hypothetical protein